jgi:hypothetical protein
MNSDQKTSISSLIALNASDLFTLKNISSSVVLSVDDEDNIMSRWETVISMLPLEFFRIIESYPNMITIEKFDRKYACNPKLCAYERYGMTNMWRPLMILNRCPSITRFSFSFIKYYNVDKLAEVLSVLMARVNNNE